MWYKPQEERASRARIRKDRVKRAIPRLRFPRGKLSSHHDLSRDDAAVRLTSERPENNRAGNSSDLSWKLKIDYCAE